MVRYRRRKSYGYAIPERIKKLQALIKSPEDFYKQIFSPTSEYIESRWRVFELIKLTPVEIRSTQKFRNHLGNAVVDILSTKMATKRTNYYKKETPNNSDYPRFINYCEHFISDDAKNKILDLIIAHNKNFYSVAKKMLCRTATKYLNDNDDRALDVLRQFYRVIPINEFDSLVAKIPNGLDNPKAKDILSKTKLFEYLKYDEEKVNASFNEKVKLTKAVAKTTTLIKRIPFVLQIGAKHIEKIPPATRFKFLQFAFRHEIQQGRYGWTYGATLQSRAKYYKSRANEIKLQIDPISVEEMKELLFAICLQKNEEFAKWLTDYEIYLTCLNSDKRVDVAAIRASRHV